MTKKEKTAKKIRVKQIASPIRRIAVQRTHLKCLGLGKISAEAELENNSTVQGLIRKVRHMIEVVEC